MSNAFDTTILLTAVAGDELADLVAGARRSLVQVRSGRFGSGSGIVWRDDGIIMTNHHVVARSDRATVLLDDDREFEAQVIARDPVLDLAALRIDAADLPVATIGASEQVRVGELVLAVGHPWGQRSVATAGIVSGIGEIEVPWRRANAEYIRSDVQLAPGNSGGPMLDASGRVIGINAMIFGGDLGVAIPSHIATQFLLVAEGQRPILGVGVQPVELPNPARDMLGRDRGLMVVAVEAGSSAQRAGLFLGDVLLDVRGTPVRDAHTLAYTLARAQHGDQVDVRLLRGGGIQTVPVQLGAPVQAAA